MSAIFFPQILRIGQKRTDWTFAQTICTNLKQMRISLNYLLQVVRHVYYSVKTQQHSLQWKSKPFPKLKEARQSWSNVKIILLFWLLRFCAQWVRSKEPLTALQHLQKTRHNKGLELWRERRWFIHHNPPAHTHTHSALRAQVSSEKQNSSDSSATLQLWSLSSRLFMFPKLATSIKECRYESTEGLHSSITAKADLLKIVCRTLCKAELLLESLY
jgi:hypothetical protein